MVCRQFTQNTLLWPDLPEIKALAASVTPDYVNWVPAYPFDSLHN